MQMIKCLNYDHISMVAADIVVKTLKKKPNSIISLPMGTTPIGLYNELIQRFKRDEVDFSKAVFFGLKEVYPITTMSDQSMDYFLHSNFFDNVNVAPENIHLPNGAAMDMEEECKRFDELLDTFGRMDLQILGVDCKGRVAQINPADEMCACTHLSSVENDMVKIGRHGGEQKMITVGMSSILRAERIILLVNGERKADVMRELFTNKVTTRCPVTLLNLHPNVTVIMDKLASSKIVEEDVS